MLPYGVQINLEYLREAKRKWDDARREFDAGFEYIMKRLLNEAALNRMSPEQVARASGLTVKRVRLLMRQNGLNPKSSKTLLSAIAADNLRNNAALLDIEPHEMDLMSPLAYLPMGKELREELAAKPEVSGNPDAHEEQAEREWEEWANTHHLHLTDNDFRTAFFAGFMAGRA